MKTIKTISNISYNSITHFEQCIKSLWGGNKIDWAYWIYHRADTDETKDHIHFVLRPSARIDTSDLRKFFNEIDPTHPDKPLTCTCKWNFTNSMDDWLLYAIHHPAYLKAKGETRNIFYEWGDINSTDPDALRNDIQSIDMTKWNRLSRLEEAVRKGIPFYQLVQDGLIPIAQRAQYQQQYRDIAYYINRPNGGRRVSHEVIDDEGDIVLAEVPDTDPINDEF